MVDRGAVLPRHELTDQEWELPAPLVRRAVTGRPRVDDRQVINGMVYKIRTGIAWRDLSVVRVRLAAEEEQDPRPSPLRPRRPTTELRGPAGPDPVPPLGPSEARSQARRSLIRSSCAVYRPDERGQSPPALRAQGRELQPTDVRPVRRGRPRLRLSRPVP
ncbi:transposase [Streptomyces sp. NPDC057543]|uniref:transposase n=1 Tax=Streptomyces sp. NPDC057543 TaxID=3346163 RepID=UPI003673D907